jgi:hypothetical protein
LLGRELTCLGRHGQFAASSWTDERQQQLG